MNDDGTVTCERCKGRCYIIYPEKTKLGTPIWQTNLCPKCHGIGKFDWIEYAIGEKKLSKRNVAV